METRKRMGAADGERGRTFAELLDRQALDSAYRYATLILGDPADAEDATHDAALTAWRKYGELRDRARFEAWFGRILVNACRDRIRLRRRRPVLLRPVDGVGGSDSSAPWPDDRRLAGGTTPSHADHAEGVARRMAMADALRSLTPDHREVVVLRFYADLTVEQIAARTGVGPGTVKSRLHYALRELRSAVGEQDEEVRHER